MTVQEFLESAIDGSAPPDNLTVELQALWHAKTGNWDAAHNIAQDIHTPTGSWIHAHLHVVEGDLGNAGYWYRKAGRPASGPERLDEEFQELVEAVLGR